MTTGSQVAICLRCEWRGDEPDGRPCPRCGTPLYRSEPPPHRAQARRTPRPAQKQAPRAPKRLPEGLKAEILDPPEVPGHDVRAPLRRRRWPLPVALAVALIASVVLTSREPDPAPGEAPAAEAQAVEEPAGIAGRRVEVPAPLRALVEHRRHLITLVAAEDLTDPRNPLFRLWRLDPNRGSLVPGPVVPPIQEMRSDPRPRHSRVGFIAGGDLFLLDGFVGARPRRVAGNVRAFEFLPNGSVVYASVTQRWSRCCGGTEAVVHVGRTRNDSPLRADRFSRRVRSLTVQGVGVSGTSAYVWGIQGGGHHLVELDLERRRRIERPLGGLRAIGIGPDGRLLVGFRAGIGHVSLVRPEPDGAMPRVPGFLLRQLLGWSADGTTLAAYGLWDGREGLWTIRLGRSRPVYGTSASGPPNAAAFLRGGKLLAWTEPGYVAVADVAGGSVHRIALPEGFTELLAAVAAG